MTARKGEKKMIKRRLGRTGYEVSALGLGGYQLTGEFRVPMAEADSIIDYALAHGINLIDTAESYGYGEGEAIVGRALARHKGHEPYVCAKVGHLNELISRRMGDEAYIDYDEIMRCIKHSMWVLRIDHFDLLMYHETERQWKCRFETGDCVAQTVLEDLKKEGIAGAIGTSCWDHSVLTKVVKTGRVDTVLSAGGISLLSKVGVEKLIPACEEADCGLIVGGCLGQGIPGLIFENREFTKALIESGVPEKADTGNKINALYDLAKEAGMTMVEMAIRYTLSFEGIHSNVMGARELAHLESNIASAEKGPLPEDMLKRIDEIQKQGYMIADHDITAVLM